MAALAGEAQHGYGIIVRVRDLSGGRVQLRVGTLFTVLDKLQSRNLVSVDADEIVGGRVRRYYRLSAASSARPAVLAPERRDLRVGDAERDGAAAALAEQFARGALTAAELHARLEVALAAVTRGDISRATQDLSWQHAWPEGGGGDGVPDLQARHDAQAP